MRSHCLQGAIGWLVAGVIISFLFSLTAGPLAWWIMAAVSPYVIAYTCGAMIHWNDDY